MTRYAEGTSVAVDRTRVEIERALMRWGADGFMYGYDNGRSIVAFRAHNRHVRFELPQPDPSSVEFTHTPTGKERTALQAQEAYEKEERRRWRALLLIIKAKLEAVASGIVTFEDEFLAHIVLPSGETLGAWIAPQVESAYSTGRMPKSLLAIGAGDG